MIYKFKFESNGLNKELNNHVQLIYDHEKFAVKTKDNEGDVIDFNEIWGIPKLIKHDYVIDSPFVNCSFFGMDDIYQIQSIVYLELVRFIINCISNNIDEHAMVCGDYCFDPKEKIKYYEYIDAFEQEEKHYF